MPYSYNGWSASPTLALRPLVVAGEAFVPGVRDDDTVYAILQYVAEQMHERVEPIVRGDWHQMDDWGFNYRLTTNDNSLSCHASATAIDYNATRHPFGVAASVNFTPAQIAEIRKILAEVNGVVTWGGDYNTPDAMHFELNTTDRARLAVAVANIKRLNQPEDDMPYSKAELTEIVRDAVKAELNDDLIAARAQVERLRKRVNEIATNTRERDANLADRLEAAVRDEA